ncbi:MAG: dockerin type I domain-containing protein [Candidatus Saccharimonadia bacterium]
MSTQSKLPLISLNRFEGMALLVVIVLAVVGGIYFLFFSRAASCTQAGDVNCDGVVNILDLSAMASNWASSNSTWSTGDLNGDGKVNITDLSILASNWGTVAPVTLNSVARILYDMIAPHEGVLHGVPLSYSWASTPTVGNPTPPTGMGAITAWGQIYADATTTEPANVRVEMKNMETYLWSNSAQKWNRVQSTVTIQGAHYVEDFVGNVSIAADARTEADGGISTTMVSGYNFHFYPPSRATVPNPSDVGAVFTTYQARLILDNPAGANNLAQAKYLANVGADWWVNTTIGFGTGNNNPGVGQGRFTYLTSNWQAENFYTGGPTASGLAGAWAPTQLQANPPPLDGMGLP